jgi:hypothetical protein
MASNIDYHSTLFTGDEITPAIAKAANIAKTYGLALIKARTPVDKGDLQAGWKGKLEGNGVRWSNDTSYAGFVEFGTKKMAPRLMLTMSLPDIAVVFEEELGKELGKRLASKAISDMVANPVQPTYTNQGAPKIKGGLAGRKYSKEYLFANPKKILTPSQENDIAAARPLIKKR